MLALLVRQLVIGEKPPDLGQVAFDIACVGVLVSEDAASAPRCVIEEPLGKDEFVSRGSGAPHDRKPAITRRPFVI